MRLTQRDRRILETIHAFDGVMSLKQIDQLFFSGHGRTQPRARMRQLCANGYVAAPDRDNIHRVPRGETIYWLGKEGAALVAGLQGMALHDFHWLRRPRYAMLSHDLAVNDFRIIVQTAAGRQSELTLQRWIPEGEFLSRPDKITYTDTSKKRCSRSVRPDGFFTLQHALKPYPFAFLLEMDMGTEDNPRFVREKVRPGLAYLHSEAYRQRFGVHHGRFLVITTGQRRLYNMKVQAECNGGAGLFYFTTLTAVNSQTVLSKPVWWLAGRSEPLSILP